MEERVRILSTAELPAQLDMIDQPILDRLLTRRQEAALTRRLVLLAAFASLGGGIFASAAMPEPAIAASSLSPLVPDSPLACCAPMGPRG